jgi:predicted ATPase with chaperone activity
MPSVLAHAAEFRHALLLGAGDEAQRFAQTVAESLPVPTPRQTQKIIEICEAAGIRCKAFPDTSCAPLRAPHFAAHPIGIFGGGTGQFPGEFKLASYGVLLFRDIDCFRDEIVREIAKCLAHPQPLAFPRVLIHAPATDRIPAPIYNLGFPRISLKEVGNQR